MAYLIELNPTRAEAEFQALRWCEDAYQRMRDSAWERRARLKELVWLLDKDYDVKEDWE